MAAPDPSITDWIGATSASLTLAVAVVVGVYSRRAARWTQAQARAAREQVDVANEALAVAREEARAAQAVADRRRLESEQATRRFLEAQVDAFMPVVVAQAAPGNPFLEVGRTDSSRAQLEWHAVDGPLELTDDEVAVFRINAEIKFMNDSAQIAMIAIVDPGNGETDVGPGGEVLLRPGHEKTIRWSRTFSSYALRTDDAIALPEIWLMNLRFWVRDLGMNAYDIQVFNAGLPFFSRDGSRLRVQHGQPFVWTGQVAMPLPGRVYDRLDAAVPAQTWTWADCSVGRSGIGF